MRKLVVAGVCAVAVAVVGPAPVAQAADKCASKAEYRQIKNGMTKKKVAQVIGYRGTSFFSFEGDQTREYAACSSRGGFVLVSFRNSRVTSKRAVWG